jgi:hypothetical protein
MSNRHKCIDVCNLLLRGELSAVETYTQAIEKFEGDGACGQLETIRTDHEHSASAIRHHLIQMRAIPKDSSGAWGSFAQAVEGTAKLLGESPALAALEQGEEIGASDYRDALGNEDVMTSIKDEIRKLFLPRVENHITTLKAIRNR